jgi:hypothetical protein
LFFYEIEPIHFFQKLIGPRHRETRRLPLQELQQLLEVLVVLTGPSLRIIFIVVTLHVAIPGREPLKECTDTHLEDVLAVKLLGIDMEMMSTSIQILSQLLRNLHYRKLIDLLRVFSIVERLARSIVHHQIHMNKEIKAHLRSQGKLCWT